MVACENSFATPGMLASLCRNCSTDYVSYRRRAKTFFWALVLRLFEIAVWLHVLRSDFALGLAHTRGSTALHAAAKHGHAPLVEWLLDNGARQSLHVKNAMGCTPLDVTQVFGPYHETSALLVQAIMSVEFEKRHGSLRQRASGGARHGI